jgi:VanZ family protein
MQRAFPRATNKTVFVIAFFIGCIVSGSGEIGQIFLATRYADLTDSFLGACGAGVGSLLPYAVRSKTVS